MDTSAPPSSKLPASTLADEIRHSAMLLGGALGLMGAFALLLLVLSTRYGS